MSNPMTPDAFARIVAEMPDEELAKGLALNRELILSEIFRQMPASLDRPAVGELAAVVHWRLGGREDGAHDVWQVTLSGGQAVVERDGGATPDVTYTMEAIDFLKLVAGRFEGPELFLSGRLVIEGDLMLAGQMPSLFRRPSA